MNDLALVHFNGGLPLHAQIIPLFLEDLTPEIELTSTAIEVEIAGYGKTSPDDNSNVALNKTRQRLDSVFHDMILLTTVSGEPQSSACSGDSGGPAFIERHGRLMQWGVAKAVTKPFCLANSYYTNIFAHRQLLVLGMQALNKAR